METAGKRPVAGIIYADGQKKYIPLMFALPIAFVASLSTLIVFNLLGAGSNAILSQIEIILLAIFFCLPGILTRSKLRGILFSVPLTWLVIIIWELILSGLFGSGSYNPYAVAGVLREPLTRLINSNAGLIPGVTPGQPIQGLGLTVEELLSFLIVVDLIILSFIIFFGSWAASWVATLFWDKEGNLSIIAVIFKPIAIVLAIVFLFFFPIVIHATSATTGGAGFIVAGLGEIVFGFQDASQSGAVAGQFNGDFSIDNLNIEALRDHTTRAKSYFDTANGRFNQLQGNILFSFVLDQLANQYPQLRNIDNTLDLVGTIGDVTYVLPELFYMFLNAKEGLDIIGEAISSSQDVTYNPDFKIGLNFLNLMGGNFSSAWDCKNEQFPEGKENCGLKAGLETATSIQDIGALDEYVNLADFIAALEIGVGAFDQAWPAFLPFLNGTYKIILGLSALGTNQFSLASSWVENAATEFEESDTILSNVIDIPPINITVTGSDPIYIPIEGVIHLAEDLNRLLIPFSYSSAAGINFFVAMGDLMVAMQDLHMNDNTTIGLDQTWIPVENNLTIASNSLVDASFNIGLAKGNLTSMVTNPRYGPLLNPVFVGQQSDPTIVRQLEKVITQFDSNLSILADILSALTFTVKAFRNFGSATANLYGALGTTPQENLTRAEVLIYYQNAIGNATEAWNILDATTASAQLNSDSRISWLNMLLSQYGDETPDLAGTGYFNYNGLTVTQEYGGIIAISDVMYQTLEIIDKNPTIYDTLINLVESLDLGSLFGS